MLQRNQVSEGDYGGQNIQALLVRDITQLSPI